MASNGDVLPEVDVTTWDNCAIRQAAANGHLEIVRFLSGLPEVDVAAENNHAIRQAAHEGHLEVVKFLLTLPEVRKSYV